ncbi:MAG: TrbC/VirB2 family protein [Rickettsiales bacterium]|nr:TrbC/VirB2 family protein [Rickettsiales bacterium]
MKNLQFNTICKLIFGLVIAIIIPFDVLATQPPEKTLYEEICDIRQMFCGGAALGLVAGIIAILGFMMFKGKLSMGLLLTTIVGIVIFISANILVEAIFNPPAGAGVVQACECIS